MEWKRKSAKGIGYHLLQLQVCYWFVILFGVEHYCELTGWPSRCSRMSVWYLAVIEGVLFVWILPWIFYVSSRQSITDTTEYIMRDLICAYSFNFCTLKMMQILVVKKWPCLCSYTIHLFPNMCNKYAVLNIPTLRSGKLGCPFWRKKHAISNLFYFRKSDQHGFDIWIWPARFVWSRRLWCFVSR